MTAEVNPRSITDAERPWLDDYDLERQAELVQLLRDVGYPDSTALGLAAWLGIKATGARDETSPPTRAKYRKILADLGERSPRPTSKRRRSTGTLTEGRPSTSVGRLRRLRHRHLPPPSGALAEAA